MGTLTHTLLGLHLFVPEVLFSVQNPVQDPTLMLVVISPWESPWLSQLVSFPLCLKPRQFWGGLGRYFIKYPLVSGCLMFFFMVRLGCWVWGRKTTDRNCPSDHISHIDDVSTGDITLKLILITWLRYRSSGFSTFFPLPHSMLHFGGKSLSRIKFHLHKLFGILLYRRFVYSP